MKAESHFLPGFQMSLRHGGGVGQVNGSFEFEFAGGFVIPKHFKADSWLTPCVWPSGVSCECWLSHCSAPSTSEFTYLGDCPGL